MGRHKDSETLKFIKWLKDKGDNLGYLTQEEYPIGEGFFIDLIWKYNEKMDPLVTFEIETSNQSDVFKNTMKIFSTRQSVVIKPLQHFSIILKNSLTKYQKECLHLFLDHYNIELFENAISEPIQKELERKLDNLPYNPLYTPSYTPLSDNNEFLYLFKEQFLFGIYSIKSATQIFGSKLPYLLKEDFVPPGEIHPFLKAQQLIDYSEKRLTKIKKVSDIKPEDYKTYLSLSRLATEINALERNLIASDICPKCGSKLIGDEIYHGGTEDNPMPYAITYYNGCESCDYELNRDTIYL